MKRLLTLLVGLVISLSAFADTISLGYYSIFNNAFQREVIYFKDIQMVQIEVVGESLSERVFIAIDVDNIDALRLSLIEMKEKFIEWNKVVKDNGVKKYTKLMPIQFPYWGAIWGPNSKYVSTAHTPDALYIVDETGCSVFLCSTAKEENNSNITQYYTIPFSSVNDINSLIKVLDINNVQKKANLDNLFK